MSVPLYRAEDEFFRTPRPSASVTTTRQGATVVSEPACGDGADPTEAARRIPTEMLSGQGRPLAEPREIEVAAR